MRPIVSMGRKHSATVRMRGAARCLSKCGLSFKGLVIAARLCGAALCFCSRDSTLSSFPLLLSLLPLQAYALTFHTTVTGIDTSALKHPASFALYPATPYHPCAPFNQWYPTALHPLDLSSLDLSPQTRITVHPRAGNDRLSISGAAWCRHVSPV